MTQHNDVHRVLRGGAWISGGVGGVRAGLRFDFVSAFRFNYVGFRCAL